MDKQPKELPTDAELTQQVDAFALRYLGPTMEQAYSNGEDGLIIALALMQQAFETLQLTVQTEAAAIDFFEDLAATYVRNWREQLENGT